MTLSIKQIEELLGKITQGEWELWDGCSWRRFGIKGTDKAFIEPWIASDGHPDMIIKKADAEFICNASSIIRQLIKERNAYREVAIQMHVEESKKSDSDTLKALSEDQKTLIYIPRREHGQKLVDALANRLEGDAQK